MEVVTSYENALLMQLKCLFSSKIQKLLFFGLRATATCMQVTYFFAPFQSVLISGVYDTSLNQAKKKAL